MPTTQHEPGLERDVALDAPAVRRRVPAPDTDHKRPGLPFPGELRTAPAEANPPRPDVVAVPGQTPRFEPRYKPYDGPAQKAHTIRLVLVGIMWLLGLGAITSRLAKIQIFDHEKYLAKAAGQQERQITLAARRGKITDRTGRDLAVSLAAASVSVNPRKLTEMKSLSERVSEISGEPAQRIYQRISKPGRAFAWVARNIETDQAQRIFALAPHAMTIHPVTKRKHPLGGLAGQVLGHVSIDNVGGEGLEAVYNQQLRGKDGWMISLVDGLGEQVPNTAQPLMPPVHGNDLTLTIDADYQAIVEQELAKMVDSLHAAGGLAVLYEASTGAIRAMANVPTYNPDESSQTRNGALRRNRAITDPYEPGSMFKAITVSAAMAEGKVTPDDMIDCQGGRISVAGGMIRDSHPNGVLDVRGVIAHSSNVGTIKISQRISSETFYRYMRAFGLGSVTNVDLPGETRGLLARPSRWSARTHATIAMGQEVGVTALQMAVAYGAIANGGVLMAPRVVERITTPDGRIIHAFEPRKVRQVIPAAVADSMVNMLCGVVEKGTGKKAAIPGVRVGGKTGTAQMAAAGRRGYEHGAYIASFIGFLPDMDPRLVCVVSVTKPQGSYYGATVAGPVFKNIMTRIINRDAAVLKRPSDAVYPRMPDVVGMSEIGATARLASLGIPVRSSGRGSVVVSQWPPPDCRVSPNRPALMTLAERGGPANALPDVTGTPVRQAVATLSAAGFLPRWEGSGIVIAQEPPPGALPEPGCTVVLRCQRTLGTTGAMLEPDGRDTPSGECQEPEAGVDDADVVMIGGSDVASKPTSLGATIIRRGRSR